MDKLSFLNVVQKMIETDEIKLVETDKCDAMNTLDDIRLTVRQELRDEVIRDITGAKTIYYAPDFDTWQDFLAFCNGNPDYETILRTQFTHDDLECLWQSSHIAEEMTEREIEQEITQQISQLKMLELVNRMSCPDFPEKMNKTKEILKANVLGLYNILFE